MPTSQIFYSWQSDLPSQTNKTFIQEALEKAAQKVKLEKTLAVELAIDRDTLGEPGSPDITTSIFKKIDKAAAFVADVSIVHRGSNGRSTPNPNVLIELGYALKTLSAQRVILIFNMASGAISELPFDLRSRRVLTYHLSPDVRSTPDREHIESSLCDAIIEILKLGSAEEFSRNSTFATELLRKLVLILSLGEEAPRRELKPWLDEIEQRFRDSSRWLRNANSSHLADELNLSLDIENLANLLDKVASHRHAFGNHDEYLEKILKAVESARTLRDKLLQHGPLDENAREQIIHHLEEFSRGLHNWVIRIEIATEEEDYHLFEDLLTSLIEIGDQLEQISYYPLNWTVPDLRMQIRTLGQDLHLVQHDHELSRYGDEEGVLEVIKAWDTNLQGIAQRAAQSR